MALTKCPECGTQISDKAASCPSCGCPINGTHNQSSNEHGLVCPKCGSSNVYVGQKGFSGGKALVGAVAVGGLGLLAGTHGKNDLICNCLTCNHKFTPDQSISDSNTDFWNHIDNLLRNGSLSDACKYYYKKTGITYSYEVENRLEKRLQKLNPKNAAQIIKERNDSNCLVAIVTIILFIIIAIATIG